MHTEKKLKLTNNQDQATRGIQNRFRHLNLEWFFYNICNIS